MKSHGRIQGDFQFPVKKNWAFVGATQIWHVRSFHGFIFPHPVELTAQISKNPRIIEKGCSKIKILFFFLKKKRHKTCLQLGSIKLVEFFVPTFPTSQLKNIPSWASQLARRHCTQAKVGQALSHAVNLESL